MSEYKRIYVCQCCGSTATRTVDKDQTLKKLSRAAYTGFCSNTNFKSVLTCEQMPEWDELSMEVVGIWTRAAESMLEYMDTHNV